MKKITFLFFLVFLILKTGAQDYLINFKAKGIVSTLTFIEAKNITRGTTKPLNGTDILHLSGPSAINDRGIHEETVLIKPNPMQGEAELSFYAKQSGNVQIVIFDISGKKVIETSDKLSQGTHKYEIKGLKEGVYIIKINGKSFQYNSKLISNNSIQNHPGIKYLGFVAIHNILKSTLVTVEMYYEWGDTIRFIGFSNTLSDTIFDMPASNKTITFIFPGVPLLSTKSVTDITCFTSVCGGDVYNDGGGSITSRGICWGTVSKPTLADNYSIEGSGAGTFVSNITGLTPNTYYNVRSYAINFMGIGYGYTQSFMTPNFIPGQPYEGGLLAYILKTYDSDYEPGQIRGIVVAAADQSKSIQWYNGSSVKTSATALGVGGGKTNTESIVAIQGAGSYAARLCNDLVLNGYSDWYLPNLDEMQIIRNFSASIGGFTEDNYWTSSETNYNFNNVYYCDFKYASYGDTTKNMHYGVRAARIFSPIYFLPDLITTSVTIITETTAKSGGTVSADGGQNVTERGICWSVNPNPTINNNIIKDAGNGRGNFNSNITGLTTKTKYYVRAYATTISGTSYGNEITFTTL